jgi:hypothetical protein
MRPARTMRRNSGQTTTRKASGRFPAPSASLRHCLACRVRCRFPVCVGSSRRRALLSARVTPTACPIVTFLAFHSHPPFTPCVCPVFRRTTLFRSRCLAALLRDVRLPCATIGRRACYLFAHVTLLGCARSPQTQAHLLRRTVAGEVSRATDRWIRPAARSH